MKFKKIAPSSCSRLFIFFSIFAMSIEGCNKQLGLSNPVNGPMEVFNEVWTVIDQRYALFAIKNVDWNADHRKFEQLVRDNMTDEDLFMSLTEMLSTLKDGHVSLTNSEKVYTYDQFYTGYPANFNLNNLLHYYIVDRKVLGPLIYTIKDNVGYVYLSSFADPLTSTTLDTLFSSLSMTKGLIIDVRDNSGGNLHNAQLLCQRFLSKKTLVGYEMKKKGTGHDDFEIASPLYLEGSPIPYIHPVCVLTNRKCFSACNDFVMYMNSVPAVKIIGDSTGGGGGIPAEYILSNGWRLRYTSTLTESPAHLPVEMGIAPTLSVGISQIELDSGKDPILEKAFSILQ